MTLKGYISSMSMMSAVCWMAWGYVIWTINPERTNWIGFTLFYVSLFLALTGTAAIVGFVIRFVAMKKKIAFRLVKEAFRQSFLFSSLIVISLYLSHRGLFTWLNMFFLVIGLSVLEYFLLSYKRK